MSAFIHSFSDVQSTHIGEGTRIWQFCVVYKDAVIGRDCNICAGVLIEGNVRVGDHVTIKSGVQVWDGTVIEDNVFLGPNATLTNDRVPRSRNKEWRCEGITLKKGCSIGANATVLPGVTIGEHALVGAGAVITKDVPPYTVWAGNPARQTGYITIEGKILDMDMKDKTGKVVALQLNGGGKLICVPERRVAC